MVESAANLTREQLYDQLDQLDQQQLEQIIAGERDKADNARFVLGRLMIEGTSPTKVPVNDAMGANYIKTAAKNDHLHSIEYKTYYDIRFDRAPNLKKIMEGLEKVCDQAPTQSSRACNTIAEFSHASQHADSNKEKAAQFYKASSEQGCLIGTHWLGVFYMEGFGVAANLDKAEICLLQAAKAGNAQSNFQLFQLYSTVEEKKDPVKAYKQIWKAVTRGVTYFDQLQAYFKANFAVLAPIFCEMIAVPAGIDKDDQTQMTNLHESKINDQKNSFMAALGKDRMYKRECGAVTDQQIWMIGVLVKYFMNKVMRMDCLDFQRAIKTDLGPILGDTGMWALKNYMAMQTQKGNLEKKKIARNAIDLLTKYLETGLDVLGIENKYNMLNRFGPKKCPDKKVVRNTIPILYSWAHYAPLQWFNDQKKFNAAVDNQQNNGGKSVFKICSFCSSPEGATQKHRQCSACKQRLYCSVDCQRNDWRKGHKNECKALAAAAAARGE